MSHYTMHESTVTRKNFDVEMLGYGTLAAVELQDALAAADSVRSDASRTMNVSEMRVTIIDDTIRIYFDITERK